MKSHVTASVSIEGHVGGLSVVAKRLVDPDDKYASDTCDDAVVSALGECIMALKDRIDDNAIALLSKTILLIADEEDKAEKRVLDACRTYLNTR